MFLSIKRLEVWSILIKRHRQSLVHVWAIFHRRKWLKTNKKKLLWNSTSNKGQNKKVHQIGLISLSWSQRKYSVLVPFLNSVAL